MAQDNVATARRVYEAFGDSLARADLGATAEWREIIDPDVVIEEVADFPEGAVYRGHEGVEAWMRGFLEVFDELSIEPQEYIAAGDTVVVPTRQWFRSKAGLEVGWEVTQVLRFRAGKLVYGTGYRDHSKALAAAGLAQ